MSERAPSSLEQDLRKTQESNFCNLLNAYMPHSEGVLMESIKPKEGDPMTTIMIVLRENTQSSEGIDEIRVNLGLGSDVEAVIYPDGGSCILIDVPISDGRIEQIFNDQPEIHPMLKNALGEVRQESNDQAKKIDLDSRAAVRAAVQASLGRTYSGHDN
ncbi:MAG: hypothetical protein WCI37_00755 [bacterium]